MGEVTDKGTIFKFWSVTLTSGLKTKSISTKKHTPINKLNKKDVPLEISQDKPVSTDGGGDITDNQNDQGRVP